MRIDKNTTIRLGNRNIVKIKIGDSVIWQKTTGPVVGPDYFYIESLGDGNTISVKNKGDGSTTNVTPTLEYSTDKNTWNTITFDWTNGNHTTELPVKLNTGGKMYFRNDTHKFSGSYDNYITFSSTVSSNVGGDIRTLSNYLDVDNETTPQEYMFKGLFYDNNKIVNASNLRLPYTRLASYCYESMFWSCGALTSTPALPATTLANACYSGMFGGTSLTSAPALPATYLSPYCYTNMFQSCTSLTTAPELPATKLAGDCYSNMFRGCTSLTTAPALPATKLEGSSYQSMFHGCTKLTTAPALPATSLASFCYSGMFYDCTSLTTAPALPATYLSYYCYNDMFSGCGSLTTAPALPATYLAEKCYNNMFRGCRSLTTAPELPATTLEIGCYNQMFSSCSKLTTAPALPATKLINNCYQSMFQGCTSLTTAPALPATKLINNCYQSMFQNCTNLNYITVYATDISATDCTTNWLSGVASTGTFNNLGFAPFETGVSGIPSGWVVSEIQSITANPDTFTIKSYKSSVNCTSTLTITTTTGKTVTDTNTATITVGENTGDTTRTLTETIPYKGSSYQVTIVQTANDVRPTTSWNVVSTGTYPFELNTNNYYESTNKGHDSSYSYATLNYSGFDELILECINSGETSYDYGIISQPDVLLSESYEDDGATGSAKVFKNFKGESSTNPVQITIPSDEGSHFITIKFRKDSSQAAGNDSLQFKVIEPQI